MSNEGGDGSDPSNSNGGPNHPTGGPSGPNHNGNNPITWVSHTNDGDIEEDSDTDKGYTEDVGSDDGDYGTAEDVGSWLKTVKNPINNILQSAEKLDSGETLSGLDKEKFEKITGLESGPYKETIQSWIQAAENDFNEARLSVDSKELNRTDK
jgi:hypothetical protein